MGARQCVGAVESHPLVPQGRCEPRQPGPVAPRVGNGGFLLASGSEPGLWAGSGKELFIGCLNSGDKRPQVSRLPGKSSLHVDLWSVRTQDPS